jgi:ankyrin repeat protein
MQPSSQPAADHITGSTEMAKPWMRCSTHCLAALFSILLAGQALATELYDAVKAKDANQVRLLLNAGADPNQRSPYDGPLHLAARLGMDEIATGLIDAGADVELPGFGGARPLHAATVAQQGKVVSLLLRRGASVDALDNAGRTALLSFVSSDATDLAVLKELLTSGADANLLDGASQLHALDHVAIHGRPEIAELLIAFGADVNAKDNLYGDTPLHYAIAFCMEVCISNLEVARALIEGGADVNATNSDGQTPLTYARRRVPNAGLLHQLLIAAGAR